MGKDSFRFAYDPVMALRNAPKLLGMELKPNGTNKLCGAYYLTGEPHQYRKDKIKLFVSRGSVWVSEEGGRCISLPQWLMEYGGAADFKEALKMINGESQAMHWSGEVREAKKGEVKYVSKDVLEGARQYDLRKCALFRWMCGLFPEERVREVWNMYNVTTDSHGFAVFWYVNREGKILYDKRIAYKEDGHRDKGYFPARQFRVADGYSGRCYFGENVADDGRKAFICEAEKSMLLGALYYGRRFLATGGKSNLRDTNDGYLLLPDMDAREQWSEKGEICPWWEKWGLSEGEIPRTADIGDMIEWRIKNRKI